MAFKYNKSKEGYLNQIGKCFQDNKIEEAKKLLDKAIVDYPKSAEFHYNLGLIYAQKNNYKNAISSYKKASSLLPTFELAHLNLGVIYIRNNQIDEGIKVFENFLNTMPYSFSTYFNLGLAMKKKCEYTKALQMFHKSLDINPDLISALSQIGMILIETGKFEASTHYFQSIIARDPKNDLAYSALGYAYQKLRYSEKAKEAFQKASELNPSFLTAIDSEFIILRQFCDWNKARKVELKLHKQTINGLKDKHSPVEPPLVNLMRTDNKSLNLEVARYTSGIIENDVKFAGSKFVFNKNKLNNKKLNIGYISSDFCEHPVATQVIDLFKYHDRNKFNIYVYSYGSKNESYWYKKIKSLADFFVDMENIDHVKIAQKIYDDKIDILVDLMGFTGFQRPDVMAYRPSPIQINYFGFSGSTGANYIDYIIADKTVIPKTDRKYYTEKIIYMPNCYQICSIQNISKTRFTRKDFGLPENKVVFCSPNRPEKIEKEMFDTWIKILKRVPNSVLWVYSYLDGTNKNLKKYFAKSGLNSKRLIFASQVSNKVHIARLKLADIILDTNIYSGGVTTTNALQAGVPVITICGNHYLSRMSASQLKNIGLSELIVKSLKEYENLAVSLANNPKELVSIHKSIILNLKSSPLFNSKLFTKNLEIGYINAYNNYLKDIKTDIII